MNVHITGIAVFAQRANDILGSCEMAEQGQAYLEQKEQGFEICFVRNHIVLFGNKVFVSAYSHISQAGIFCNRIFTFFFEISISVGNAQKAGAFK